MSYSVVLNDLARGPEFFRARMMRSGMKLAQIERVIEAVPCVLKQRVSLSEAARLAETFRTAGGLVEVRGAAPAAPPAAPSTVTPVRVDLFPGRDLDEAAAAARATPPLDRNVIGVPLEVDAAPPAPAVELPPIAQKPPAEWKHANPWIGRGVAAGLVGVLALLLSNCIGRYTVLDRQHAFSAVMYEDLEEELNGVVRKRGVATPADVHRVIDEVARRTHVRAEVIDVIQLHVEIVRTPMVDDSGRHVCVAANADEIIPRLPEELKLSFALRLRRCEMSEWVIGFAADVSARWSTASNRTYVEHYAFVNAFEPDEE